MKAVKYAERINTAWEKANSDKENGQLLYQQEINAVAFDVMNEAELVRKTRRAVHSSAVKSCVLEAVNKAKAINRKCHDRLPDDWFIQAYNKFVDMEEFHRFKTHVGKLN